MHYIIFILYFLLVENNVWVYNKQQGYASLRIEILYLYLNKCMVHFMINVIFKILPQYVSSYIIRI